MSPIYTCVLLCMLMSLIWRGALCQSGSNAKDLRTKIFITDNYDKKVRPATNQTDATEVWVSFYLLSINSLDEVTETLKTTGYLYIEWYDKFLTWNASDFGGIEYYHWPQDDVWKPDVALKNSYLDYKQLGVTSLNVRVDSEGYVEWYPFQVFQSTCSMDITYFPFDTQTCELKFVAWSYTTAEVIMLGGTLGIDMTFFETNSAWDVLNSTQKVEQESGEASIIYTLTMKRKPRYQLLSMVLPIIMLTVLNLFVFVLPCESGEKASYGVTVFLAFAVFMTIISSTMPENSESTAIFSIYVILQTLQSTLITVVGLTLLRINSLSEETPVPKCLIAVLRIIKCGCCGKKNRSLIKVVPSSASTGKGKIEGMAPQPTVSVSNDRRKYTWKEVVNGLDYLFFIIFLIVAIVTTTVCLVLSATIN